jgi:hypothetical protein
MSQQGRFRWGSGWVEQKQLDELREAEKKVRAKLDQMQTEFAQSQVKIGQLEREIASNNASMAELATRNYFRDADGKLIAMPLPTAYYDLQRRNNELETERETLQLRMTSLQAEAPRVKQELPVPQFTGIQRIVGWEGMPGGDAMSGPSQPKPPTTIPADPGTENTLPTGATAP